MAIKRILAATVLAGALALGTTGCSWVSPIATQRAYQPADGVNVNIGDMRVRNLRVFQSTSGTSGVIIGSFVNAGTKDSGVTLSFINADGSGSRVRVPVKAGEKVDVGYNGGAAISEGIDVKPGQRAHITVTADTYEWKAALVPVFELPSA